MPPTPSSRSMVYRSASASVSCASVPEGRGESLGSQALSYGTIPGSASQKNTTFIRPPPRCSHHSPPSNPSSNPPSNPTTNNGERVGRRKTEQTENGRADNGQRAHPEAAIRHQVVPANSSHV